MLTFIVLACSSGKVADTGSAPGGGGGEALGDTAEASDTAVAAVGDWLQPAAVWGSEDVGYTTGGALVDIDGDGDQDLVAVNGNDMEPGRLVIYENEAGVLSSSPSWASAVPQYYGHLDVGDVNGDGWMDVAVSRFLGEERFDEPGGVEIFISDEGRLPVMPSWSTAGFFSFSCALGDMDGDGDLDLAVAVGEAYYNEPGLSRVFENDGDGGFGSAAVWFTESPRHSFDVGWADLNDDGVSDLVFANSGTGHTVYMGPISGAGAADWTAAGGGFEGNTLDVGDVDGDGALDLVISDNDQLGGAGIVRAWCGPVFTLCWASADDPQMQSAVSLEDVDQDGDLDLFAGAWWGAVRMYENVDGVLQGTPGWTSDEREAVIEAFSWGDVDGDGLRELAVTNWTYDGPNLLYAR